MILKEFFSNSIIKATGILSAFFTNILLARALPPDDLGQFYIIFSLAMFLSIISRFGMRQAALRCAGEAFHRFGYNALISLTQKIIKIVLAGNLLVASVVGIAVLGIGYSFVHLDRFVFYLLIWTFSLSLIIPMSDILRAAGRVKTGVLLDASLFNVIFFFSMATASFLHKHLSIAQTLSLADIVSLLVLLIALVTFFKTTSSSDCINPVDLPSTRRILSISMPIMFINLTTFLLANSGLWVVGQIASMQDAGNYGIALKLFNLLALPLLIMNMSLEPRIVALREKNQTHRLKQLLQSSATLGFIVSFVIVLGLFLGGKSLITFLFGNDHASVYELIMVLAAANLINVATGASTSYMLVTGGQRSVLVVNCLILVVCVPLLVILTSYWGSLGAAYGTALMLVAQQFLIWQLLYRTGVTTHLSGSIRTTYRILTNQENSSA